MLQWGRTPWGERDETRSWEVIWTAEKALGQNFNKKVHYFLNYSGGNRVFFSCIPWT